MRIELNLVKCSDKSPRKDGRYTVVDKRYDGKWSIRGDMEYTVVGGWNTAYTKIKDGVNILDTKYALKLAEEPDTYWAKEMVVTEDDDE